MFSLLSNDILNHCNQYVRYYEKQDDHFEDAIKKFRSIFNVADFFTTKAFSLKFLLFKVTVFFFYKNV